MKIFIVGMNATGKQEILKDLQSLGISHGKRFCTLSNVLPEHYIVDYHLYDNKEVNRMFETKAYFFLNENTDYSCPFYEGLSLYEYENYNLFELTPDQFLKVPKFDTETVFIWLDANQKIRRTRYITERRKYDFAKRDMIERDLSNDFVETLYEYKNVLYFNNEVPERVSSIIYSLMTHPELLDVYKNRFN